MRAFCAAVSEGGSGGRSALPALGYAWMPGARGDPAPDLDDASPNPRTSIGSSGDIGIEHSTTRE